MWGGEGEAGMARGALALGAEGRESILNQMHFENGYDIETE